MNLLDQLRRDEGVRPAMYIDSVGIATIGVGHRLDLPLCPAAIDAQLRHDVEMADLACQRFAFWPRLSEARRGVLINLCFNVGLQGLLGFAKMLAAIEADDWQRAAAELLDSRYATQVGDRAKRLARQLITDEWQ